MVSMQTSYRFDDCHGAGRAKDSDEQEVAPCAATKRSQRRERGQLRYRWVYPGGFHLALDVAPSILSQGTNQARRGLGQLGG